MEVFNATEARSQLYSLIDQAAEESEPILIKGKRNNALLVSEEDWAAINETLYLCSMPGMRESILKGLEEDINGCTDVSPL